MNTVSYSLPITHSSIITYNLEENTIGEKIKKYRLAKNLKQIELGDLIGASRWTISEYEANKAIPSFDHRVKMAAVFEISPSELYPEHEDDYFNFISGNFGAKIKNIRKSLGITQADLSKIIGIRAETISCWESQRKIPSMKNYNKLIDLLHTTKG